MIRHPRGELDVGFARRAVGIRTQDAAHAGVRLRERPDAGTVAWIGTSIARLLEETELAEKWSIDASEIASAARAWTFGQACAVADAMARFRRAVAINGADAMAARQTTRPAALVLETPARRKKPGKRRARPRR